VQLGICPEILAGEIDTGWGDDDESVPLRSPAATLPGAPSHFQAPSQGGNPAAPSRPRRGRGEPEPGSRM